jgi:hypothetical protein
VPNATTRHRRPAAGHAAYDLPVTDREVELVAGSVTGGRRGKVRDFVANRSGPQRLGAIAAVLVLLSAPFGGWKTASEEDVVPLELGQKIDIGPFYVTIESVKQVTELPPVIEADPTSRFLVVRATVTNYTDRPEFADLVTDALSGDGTGAQPWEGDQVAQPRAFDVNDAVELPASEFVNPGQTYTYAFVLRQHVDVDLDRLTLAVTGYHFQEVDPHTLDPERWVRDETPLAEGHVEIEVKE